MKDLKALRDKGSGGRMAKLRGLHAGKAHKDDGCGEKKYARGGAAKAEELEDVTSSDGPTGMGDEGPDGDSAPTKPGRAKKTKGNTTINIMIASGADKQQDPNAMPPPMPMPPPGPPPMAGPPGGMPPGPPPGHGGPPPGGPPPMMGRASGGRVKMPKNAGANRSKI